MTTKTVNRHKIKFTYHEDLECVILGALGFSTEVIMQRTGLSSGQIAYRLKKAKIKRAEYRNGKSEVAEEVIRSFERPLFNEFGKVLQPQFR